MIITFIFLLQALFLGVIRLLSSKVPLVVIPADAGIQNYLKTLDSGSSPE
jgi:hypothetical protein